MTGTFEGLVIRECDCGESDKLLTVLTADKGQCIIMAKGARSMRSKLMPLCRLFVYADFEFYEKNGRRWLSGGEIISSFYKINQNIKGFALTAYILSLTAEVTGEGVGAERQLRMALNTLYAIENELKPLPQIKAAYEIFCACESGFSPDMWGCEACGCESAEGGFWLDVMNGSVMCAACRSKKNLNAPTEVPYDELMTARIVLPLDGAALEAWRYVMRAPIKRLFAFTLDDPRAMQQFSRTAEAYILNHIERGFETLDFYNDVKDMQ